MSRFATVLRAAVRSWAGTASLAGGATAGVAVYVISPRFGAFSEPSLIDDWHSMYSSVTALHQLESFAYNPALFDTGRYRPAFYAIWDYLQWHTLGAPYSMAGPNAWNVLRICALALALALVVGFGLRSEQRARLGLVSVGLLAAVPGALIFSTAPFGVDLARFGPQEPLLVAGLGLGGLALLLAAWLVVVRQARPALVAPLVVGGFLVWCFGVYMKEASVCVLVLAPFLALELRARWGPLACSPRQRAALAGIALLALAPIVQLIVEVERFTSQPTLFYGSASPHGLSQWISRLGSSITQQWNAIPTVFGQALWQGLAMALPPLLLAVWLKARRAQWLALGLIVLGWTLLAFQGVSEVVVSRYYIPVFACFAIALVILLAELPGTLRWASIVAVAVLAFNGIPDGHQAVQGWVSGEVADQQLVFATAALNPRRCLVYYANFDPERHYSLPIILALRKPTPTPCLSGQAALVILGGPTLPTAGALPIVAACAAPGWQPREAAGAGTIYSCPHLERGRVALGNGTFQSAALILASDRLVVPKRAWTG